MHFRNALKFIAIMNLVALAITAIAAYYFDRTTPKKLVDTGTMVAISICVIGALMSRGARIGDGPIVGNMTSSVADSPNAVGWADYDDMLAGVSYGALMVVAGLIWLGIVAGLYHAAV